MTARPIKYTKKWPGLSASQVKPEPVAAILDPDNHL